MPPSSPLEQVNTLVRDFECGDTHQLVSHFQSVPPAEQRQLVAEINLRIRRDMPTYFGQLQLDGNNHLEIISRRQDAPIDPIDLTAAVRHADRLALARVPHRNETGDVEWFDPQNNRHTIRSLENGQIEQVRDIHGKRVYARVQRPDGTSTEYFYGQNGSINQTADYDRNSRLCYRLVSNDGVHFQGIDANNRYNGTNRFGFLVLRENGSEEYYTLNTPEIPNSVRTISGQMVAGTRTADRPVSPGFPQRLPNGDYQWQGQDGHLHRIRRYPDNHAVESIVLVSQNGSELTFPVRNLRADGYLTEYVHGPDGRPHQVIDYKPDGRLYNQYHLASPEELARLRQEQPQLFTHEGQVPWVNGLRRLTTVPAEDAERLRRINNLRGDQSDLGRQLTGPRGESYWRIAGLSRNGGYTLEDTRLRAAMFNLQLNPDATEQLFDAYTNQPIKIRQPAVRAYAPGGMPPAIQPGEQSMPRVPLPLASFDQSTLSTPIRPTDRRSQQPMAGTDPESSGRETDPSLPLWRAADVQVVSTAGGGGGVDKLLLRNSIDRSAPTVQTRREITADGRRIIYQTVNGQDYPQRIVFRDGRTTVDYQLINAAARPTTVTHADGSTTSYVNNQIGIPIRITDRFNGQILLDYELTDNVRSIYTFRGGLPGLPREIVGHLTVADNGTHMFHDTNAHTYFLRVPDGSIVIFSDTGAAVPGAPGQWSPNWRNIGSGLRQMRFDDGTTITIDTNNRLTLSMTDGNFYQTETNGRLVKLERPPARPAQTRTDIQPLPYYPARPSPRG